MIGAPTEPVRPEMMIEEVSIYFALDLDLATAFYWRGPISERVAASVMRMLNLNDGFALLRPLHRR
jgi:hypothetical protein